MRGVHGRGDASGAEDYRDRAKRLREMARRGSEQFKTDMEDIARQYERLANLIEPLEEKPSGQISN